MNDLTAQARALDDVRFFRAVQELIAHVREDIPTVVLDTVTSEDSARFFLADLVGVEQHRMLRADLAPQPGAARRACLDLLEVLDQDPALSDYAGAALSDPPGDDQLGMEAIPETTLFIAAVVTLLMLRVKFTVKRENGQTSFRFELEKKSASDAVVRQIVELVARAFRLK